MQLLEQASPRQKVSSFLADFWYLGRRDDQHATGYGKASCFSGGWFHWKAEWPDSTLAPKWMQSCCLSRTYLQLKRVIQGGLGNSVRASLLLWFIDVVAVSCVALAPPPSDTYLAPILSFSHAPAGAAWKGQTTFYSLSIINRRNNSYKTSCQIIIWAPFISTNPSVPWPQTSPYILHTHRWLHTSEKSQIYSDSASSNFGQHVREFVKKCKSIYSMCWVISGRSPVMFACYQWCWCVSAYMQEVMLEIISTHVHVLPALYMVFVQLERVSSSAREVEFQSFTVTFSVWNSVQQTDVVFGAGALGSDLRAYVISWHGCCSHRCSTWEPGSIVLISALRFLKTSLWFLSRFFFCCVLSAHAGTPHKSQEVYVCYHSEPCEPPQSVITAPLQARSFIIFAAQTFSDEFRFRWWEM